MTIKRPTESCGQTTEDFFCERQHFKQVWMWILLIGVNGLFIYGLINQVFLGQTFGSKAMSNKQMVFVTISIFLLTILLVLLRLDTAIKQDGIYFRFLPFQWKYKKISWDRISKAFVR